MQTFQASINGKAVAVEMTQSAAAAAAALKSPLFVELELYFSCLVKKFVHFRQEPRSSDLCEVAKNLNLYFFPVTSTPCSMEEAERLGRQPEVPLKESRLNKIAPKKVFIDHKRGQWVGSFDL
jgi:hypothetical protein